MRYLAICILLAGFVFGAEDVQNGATDIITYFVLTDRTTGLRDTGVTIANLEMYYIEDQAAESADAFVGAHGAVTDAHTAGECIHVGHGLYRIDWPDAAFDGGIGKRVQLTVVDGDAGAKTETLVVQLSPPTNVITVAGTSQTGNDNGADINAILVDTAAADTTAELRTLMTGADTPVAKEATLTTIDTNVDDIETDTAAVDTTTEMRTFLTGGDTAISTITTAQVNTEADNSIESYNLDHLVNIAVDTNLQTTVHDNSVLGYMLASANVSAYVRTTDSHEDLGENIADIETDTAAADTTTELRTLMTGADTPVAKESTLTSMDSKLDTIDTNVDDIETDTAAYDTDGEYATAIWNAATASYGGGGTYGQVLEDGLGGATAQQVWEYATRGLTDESGFSLAADQSGVTIGTVNTLTGHAAQTGDSYAITNSGTYGLSALYDILTHATYGLSALRTRGDTAWITGTATSGNQTTILSRLAAIMSKAAADPSIGTYDPATDSLEAQQENPQGPPIID